MAFNLADALNLTDKTAVSKLDTGIKMIELALIDPHPENFFPVENDITDLAESIELNGLCQPLIVTPTEDGRYRTIAGHRRRAALLQLAEKNPEKWKYVACNIKHPASHELEMLMLIQTNTEAREIGWSEKNKAATMVEEILIKLQKEQGIKLPGKMRKHVADLIKSSESQLARAKFIADHLIDDAKKMNLTDSAAYKLAHLPEADQDRLAKHYKNNSWQLSTSAIKTYQDNIAAGKPPFYVEPYVRTCWAVKGHPPCDRPEFFSKHKKQCKNLSCCVNCYYRIECADACPHVRKEIREHKSKFPYKIGQRIRSFLEENAIDKNAAASLLGRCNSKDMELIETGIYSFSLESLQKFCTEFGASADDLLGLEKPAASSAQISDGWRRLYYDGKPEERQLCEVLITDNVDPGTGKKVCEVWPARWIGGKFVSALNNRTETRRTKLLWRPLPDPPEGYSFCLHAEDKSDA